MSLSLPFKPPAPSPSTNTLLVVGSFSLLLALLLLPTWSTHHQILSNEHGHERRVTEFVLVSTNASLLQCVAPCAEACVEDSCDNSTETAVAERVVQGWLPNLEAAATARTFPELRYWLSGRNRTSALHANASALHARLVTYKRMHDAMRAGSLPMRAWVTPGCPKAGACALGGGLGNQVRALQRMFYVALMAGRALFIEDWGVVGLYDVFEPHAVDWRVPAGMVEGRAFGGVGALDNHTWLFGSFGLGGEQPPLPYIHAQVAAVFSDVPVVRGPLGQKPGTFDEQQVFRVCEAAWARMLARFADRPQGSSVSAFLSPPFAIELYRGAPLQPCLDFLFRPRLRFLADVLVPVLTGLPAWRSPGPRVGVHIRTFEADAATTGSYRVRVGTGERATATATVSIWTQDFLRTFAHQFRSCVSCFQQQLLDAVHTAVAAPLNVFLMSDSPGMPQALRSVLQDGGAVAAVSSSWDSVVANATGTGPATGSDAALKSVHFSKSTKQRFIPSSAAGGPVHAAQGTDAELLRQLNLLWAEWVALSCVDAAVVTKSTLSAASLAWGGVPQQLIRRKNRLRLDMDVVKFGGLVAAQHNAGFAARTSQLQDDYVCDLDE